MLIASGYPPGRSLHLKHPPASATELQRCGEIAPWLAVHAPHAGRAWQALRVTFNESLFQRRLPTRFTTRLRERCYCSICAISSLSAATRNLLNPVGVQEPRSRKEQKSFPKLILLKEGVNALHTHTACGLRANPRRKAGSGKKET